MSFEELKDLPKIRQTRFILPKNRKYLFDVNQDIHISKLKKMIIVAANLGKNIRIFHDNIEYTDKDEYCLDELFPDLELVEFTIEPPDEQYVEIDDLMNIKLKNYCNEHKGKYPSFYCYKCGHSICTDCLKGNKHKGHNIKEKYDYLQESKDLIENLFKDLKDLLNKTNGVPEELIKQIKAKITVQFFPELVKIVKQIEQNMINLILFFLEKDQNNYKMIQNNLVNLKSSCSEGLDKLKETVDIEDLILDENVFLTIDTKFKGINNEKDKIKKDLETYKLFTENLNLIQNIVEKTYNEIYEFLIKYLEITKYLEIKDKININNISEINKKEILERILGDIKKKDTNPKFIEFLRNVRRLKNDSTLNSQNPIEDVDMKDVPRTAKKQKDKEGKIIGSLLDKDIQNTKHVDAVYSPESPGNDMKLRSGAIYSVPKTEKELLEESYDEETETGPIYRRVISIIPNTNKALIYNSHKKSNKTKELDFPNLLGIKSFLNDCSWVNYNNKLYILGGEDKGKKSRLFIEYDGIKNSFKIMPLSNFPHTHHSLFAFENSIYCIGGKDTECEKYDFETNTWTILPKLNFVQENPVLYVHNNILYSFFGNDENGKKSDNVQKLNIKNAKSKWVNVVYNRNGLNLKMSGCGIIKINENCIYFFGGKTENGISKDAIEFDFSSMRANKTKCQLGKNAFFKDSIMPKVSEDQYVNYSMDKENPIILVSGLS
jgi:hypothetical protein